MLRKNLKSLLLHSGKKEDLVSIRPDVLHMLISWSLGLTLLTQKLFSSWSRCVLSESRSIFRNTPCKSKNTLTHSDDESPSGFIIRPVTCIFLKSIHKGRRCHSLMPVYPHSLQSVRGQHTKWDTVHHPHQKDDQLWSAADSLEERTL